MFEDIEQLEKEVQDFRKNMLGSAALLKSLDAIVAALKAQTAELSAKSAEMAGKMDFQSTAIQNKTDNTLQKLVANLTDCVAELRKVTDRAVEQLSAENKENLANTTTQILSTQKAYIETLQATEKAIQACSAELSKKHGEFLDRLEKTNINQIYRACVDMRKAVETKLTILMAGVGVAIILAIVGLFI
ncbi:MAG: hypothetical protein ACI3YU_10695 [Segatella copri]